RKIAIVRGRWNTFLWLRGMAWILGLTVASLLIGLALANSTSISGWTVTVLRFGLLAAVVATVIKALVLPLRRTPTDIQLARFVELKNPGLEARVDSAGDAIHKANAGQPPLRHLLPEP